MSSITVVSSLDRHYVVPYAAMLLSLSDKSPGICTQAYVLHYDLATEDVSFLQKVAFEANIKLRFIDIPSTPFVYFSCRRRTSLRGRVTMSPIAYTKAFLDRFLPAHLYRVVCLDADTIVKESLAELEELPQDNPVLAVSNIPRQHQHQFNSGVMVVDLALWRRLKISDVAESFLIEYSDSLHSHDQHTLNLIFRQRWTKIDLKWNYMEDHYRFRSRGWAYEEAKIIEARRSPKIVHFAVGTDKPWKKHCQHPNADLYLKYYKKVRPFFPDAGLMDPQECRV